MFGKSFICMAFWIGYVENTQIEVTSIDTNQSRVEWVRSGLTQRALDWWDSARFQALCVAWSWFRYNGVISSRPPASNAHRWATWIIVGSPLRFSHWHLCINTSLLQVAGCWKANHMNAILIPLAFIVVAISVSLRYYVKSIVRQHRYKTRQYRDFWQDILNFRQIIEREQNTNKKSRYKILLLCHVIFLFLAYVLIFLLVFIFPWFGFMN